MAIFLLIFTTVSLLCCATWSDLEWPSVTTLAAILVQRWKLIMQSNSLKLGGFDKFLIVSYILYINILRFDFWRFWPSLAGYNNFCTETWLQRAVNLANLSQTQYVIYGRVDIKWIVITAPARNTRKQSFATCSLGWNISNTSDSVSSEYPNTEKWVKNTTRSGVFVTKFKSLG